MEALTVKHENASATVTINDMTVEFTPGETILNVARRAGIYIPTLCAWGELPSTGACRLCLVRVEGARGYMTACTTPAEPGMRVTTSSPEIETLRRRILELILSEHPSACLVCSIVATCDKFNAPAAKAGRVTGCNTCPNRDICELRQLAAYLGVTAIRYPLLYQGLPLEREDPFMDRDYNLCILCGRCVRVCQQVLGLSAIAFIRRGHDTKVGTCFERPHSEGNCIFCMHCVDVCPTGALSARGSKWYGSADAETPTTCILCERGCELVIDTKWSRVVGVHPARDMHGCTVEYCVKGRCCLPPLVNHANRLRYPAIRREDGRMIYTDWERALQHAAACLSRYRPDEVAVIASRHLTDESIGVLHEFARVYAAGQLFYGVDNQLRFADGSKPAPATGHIRLVYVTEANSFSAALAERFPGLEQVIVQDVYASPLCSSANVCAVLPAAAFTEMGGTKTCSDNRRQIIAKAADPAGNSLPDWEITLRLGRAAQHSGFALTDFRSIQTFVQMRPWIIGSVPAVPRAALTYRGFPIGDFVPDFQRLASSRLAAIGTVDL